MAGRTGTPGGGNYRYGFNGKENDAETGWQDYGMRMYNPRLSRFFTVDPIAAQYPELTPYQFASNRPIDGIDLDGLEHAPAGKCHNPIAHSRGLTGHVCGQQGTIEEGMRQMGVMVIIIVGAPVIVETVSSFGLAALVSLGTRAATYSPLVASVGQKYGADIGNFVYGATTGDIVEPFPSNTGVQSADAGRYFREMMKSKAGATLDFFGGAVSKYEGAISIDSEAINGFRGTIDQFAEVFKGNKFTRIIADNPQGTNEYLVSAAELLEQGGTITIRGTESNKYFNKIAKGTMPGLEHFEVVQAATPISDEAARTMQRKDGSPIVGIIQEIILKRK
jgi:RHS repeat-associated protein